MRHPLSYLKWCAYGLSAVTSLVAAGWILLAKPRELPQATAGPPEKGARIERPRIVERRDGRLLWELQAERAQQEGIRMRLTSPRLVLRTETGGKLSISARLGWFHPATRALSFAGDVQASWRGWRLACEQMRYDPASDALMAPKRVLLTRDGVRIEVGKVRLWRKKGVLRADYGVHLNIAARWLQ